MRTHYWQYLTNQEGQPVVGASITVYISGSTTPAYVYTQASGGIATNAVPQVTTNANGYFEFWVADASEVGGYADTRFAIKWSKPGVINDTTITDVDILPPVSNTYVEVIAPASVALTALQVTGTLLNNYGQTDDAIVQLPTAVKGLSCTVVLGTAISKYYRIKARATDYIYLDGVIGTIGGYVGIASPTVGASLSFKAFQTGDSKWNWYCVLISGTWVAG